MEVKTPIVKGLEEHELIIGGSFNNQPQFKHLIAYHNQHGQTISRWEPSDEERKAILDGADIFLWIHHGNTPYPPTIMEVLNPELIPEGEYLEEWKKRFSL